MAVLEISIGRSKYKVECPIEEKAKITRLAQKLDSRVLKMLSNFNSIDEKTLLVLTALTLEDEIETSAQNVNEANMDEVYDQMAEAINEVATRIEKLANKIENY